MVDIEEFLKERDAVLLSGDVDACVAFLLKHNPRLKPPSSREVAELMMHKAITGSTGLPMEYRVKSYRWLMAHGSSSLDDGDVREAAEHE